MKHGILSLAVLALACLLAASARAGSLRILTHTGTTIPGAGTIKAFTQPPLVSDDGHYLLTVTTTEGTWALLYGQHGEAPGLLAAQGEPAPLPMPADEDEVPVLEALGDCLLSPGGRPLIKASAGGKWVFWTAADGALQPVFVQGEPLPGDGRILRAFEAHAFTDDGHIVGTCQVDGLDGIWSTDGRRARPILHTGQPAPHPALGGATLSNVFRERTSHINRWGGGTCATFIRGRAVRREANQLLWAFDRANIWVAAREGMRTPWGRLASFGGGSSGREGTVAFTGSEAGGVDGKRQRDVLWVRHRESAALQELAAVGKRGLVSGSTIEAIGVPFCHGREQIVYWVKTDRRHRGSSVQAIHAGSAEAPVLVAATGMDVGQEKDARLGYFGDYHAAGPDAVVFEARIQGPDTPYDTGYSLWRWQRGRGLSMLMRQRQDLAFGGAKREVRRFRHAAGGAGADGSFIFVAACRDGSEAVLLAR